MHSYTAFGLIQFFFTVNKGDFDYFVAIIVYLEKKSAHGNFRSIEFIRSSILLIRIAISLPQVFVIKFEKVLS